MRPIVTVLALSWLVFGCGGCGGGLQKIDKSKPANSGSLTLHRAFSPDPKQLSGKAVGEREVTSYGETDTGTCRGWVSRNPDHYLTLEDRFDYLRIEVISEADTTLLVEGPEGRFCSDDQSAANRNPRIKGYFREGDYAVWVGTYQQGQSADYEIYFTQAELE